MRSELRNEVKGRRQGSTSLPWSGVLLLDAAGLWVLRGGSLNSAPGPDNSLEGDEGQDGGLPARHLSGATWSGWAKPQDLRLNWASQISAPKGQRPRKGHSAKDACRGLDPAGKTWPQAI